MRASVRIQTRGLDRSRVRDLIRRIGEFDDPGVRVATAAGLFLGRNYRSDPLDGSPTKPEELTLDLDGLDCVTHVEYALALGRARTPDDFVDAVRAIRYAGGVVEWKARNHYMTTWIRNNVKSGFVQERTRGRGLVERRRILDIVPGIAKNEVRVRSIPKREFIRRQGEVSSGDLAFFASTRLHMDIFHCGVLVVDAGDELVLRHASRSRGRVLDQSLSSFLTANRMSGVRLVRPLPS